MKKLLIVFFILSTSVISLSLNGNSVKPVSNEISVLDNQAGILETSCEEGL